MMHLLEGAVKEVNIKPSIRSDLLLFLQQKKFTREIFDSSQMDIYLLMLTDSFPRFLNSGLNTTKVSLKKKEKKKKKIKDTK